MADSENAEVTTTPFDSWRSIVMGLYMSITGYAVLVGVPVISTAWVELLGFTEEQVGRVAGADLGGLSIGALLAAGVMGHWNRRWIAFGGLALAVIANALCMIYVSYEAVLWLRVLAGTGSGIYTAVAVATLGGTSKPARAFNFMLLTFTFSQALELQVLPMLSMNGIYLAFILTMVAALPFFRWFPAYPDKTPAASIARAVGHRPIPRYVPWLVLLAIVLTYINIGTYWTYIELASIDAELDNQFVNRLLVFVSFFSLVGCLVATVISNRFGLARPLIVALICMAVTVGMLAGGMNNLKIMVSLFSFNVLWIFVDVYQMSTVANVDRTGSYASLMPGAQGLGQVIGPNIGASMLGAGMGYDSVFLMCAGAALLGMLVYAGMYVSLRRNIPALAEAS